MVSVSKVFLFALLLSLPLLASDALAATHTLCVSRCGEDFTLTATRAYGPEAADDDVSTLCDVTTFPIPPTAEVTAGSAGSSLATLTISYFGVNTTCLYEGRGTYWNFTGCYENYNGDYPATQPRTGAVPGTLTGAMGFNFSVRGDSSAGTTAGKIIISNVQDRHTGQFCEGDLGSVFECWEEDPNNAGKYVAHFGYENRVNDYAFMPFGSHLNVVTPASYQWSFPQVFPYPAPNHPSGQPGRSGLFPDTYVQVDNWDGTPLTWSMGLGTRTATLSGAQCPARGVYSCSDGVMHLDTSSGTQAMLSRVDTTTGTATLVETYTGAFRPVLAADATGTLYTMRGKELVTLGKAGALTSVGNTGIAQAVAMGIAPDGKLYVLSTQRNALYRVNKATGKATLLREYPTRTLPVDGGDFAITSGNDAVYTRTSGDVYVIDLDTLGVRKQGNLPLANGYSSSALYSGTHYAMHAGQDALYRFTLGPLSSTKVPNVGPFGEGDGASCPAAQAS